MKLLLFPFLLLLSSCSHLSYELEYLKQRKEAKITEDYLPWLQAKSEVKKNCFEVVGIYQGHSRAVSVYFNNETTLTTISPEIDQILDVILSCRGSYEGVEILME